MKTILIIGTAEKWNDYFKGYNVLNLGHDSTNMELHNDVLMVTKGYNKVIDAVFWRVGANTRTWKYISLLELIKASKVFCINSPDALLNINSRIGMLNALRQNTTLNIIDSVAYVASSIDEEKIPISMPFVVKIGNFHCARNKYLVKNKLELHNVIREIKNKNQPVVIEPFVESNQISHRYLVIGNKVFCSELKGKDWLSNDTEYDKEIIPDERLEKEVLKIAKKLNLTIAGFDFIFDRTGKEYLIEVNEDPGFENHTGAFKEAEKIFLEKWEEYNNMKKQTK